MNYEIADLPSDGAFFETLRAMKEVRPFKLVFSVDVLFPIDSEEAQRMLVGALDAMNTAGVLDFLDSPPTIR